MAAYSQDAHQKDINGTGPFTGFDTKAEWIEDRKTDLIGTYQEELADAQADGEIDIDEEHGFFLACVKNFDALPIELQEKIEAMAEHKATNEYKPN